MTSMKIKIPTKIEIKESKGKGLGVFATNDIRVNEVIEEVLVLPIPVLNGKYILENYVFEYPKKTNSKNPNELVIALGYGSMYNHSIKPNADWENHPSQRGFVFICKKLIKKGEEICIWYGGEDYWKEKNINII